MSEKKSTVPTELEGKSVEELNAIAEQCLAIVRKRDEAEKNEDLQRVNTLLTKYGVTPIKSFDELKAGFGKKTKSKGVPRYANPKDPKITWTGKGPRPGWVKEHLDGGGTIDDLLAVK